MAKAGLVRNPAYKNQGKLMALNDFLGFAKNNSVAGILINIEVIIAFLYKIWICFNV